MIIIGVGLTVEEKNEPRRIDEDEVRQRVQDILADETKHDSEINWRVTRVRLIP